MISSKKRKRRKPRLSEDALEDPSGMGALEAAAQMTCESSCDADGKKTSGSRSGIQALRKQIPVASISRGKSVCLQTRLVHTEENNAVFVRYMTHLAKVSMTCLNSD